MFSIIAEKRCTKCGETKPLSQFGKQPHRKDGHHSWCGKCLSRASSKWNKDNPEKCRVNQFRSLNKITSTNPRRKLGVTLEHVLEKARNWNKNHPERRREHRVKWQSANREKTQEYSRNQRARKKGNGGVITVQEWQDLKREYDYTCLCCKRREPEVKLELDHVLPLVLGGRNSIDNAQPLCKSCNSSKNAKHIDYRFVIK
jgi:5-methylcytosine-specific restriction endonuclease McrA